MTTQRVDKRVHGFLILFLVGCGGNKNAESADTATSLLFVLVS